MYKKLNKKVKRLDIIDIKLMHLAMVFLTFFVLLLIPPLMDWVHNANKWIFLVLAIIFFARPCSKFWKK